MNLSKTQVVPLVNLSKTTGKSDIESLHFGVNWGRIGAVNTPSTPSPKKGFFSRLFGSNEPAAPTQDLGREVDLDAAAFAFDANGKFIADVHTNLLGGKLNIGYLNHSGDDLTGDDSQDDSDNETISAYIDRIPSEVHTIVFTLCSFSGDKFDEIPYANLRIYEGQPNQPIGGRMQTTFELSNDATFKGAKTVVVGKLYRSSAGWDFMAIGATSRDSSIRSQREQASLYAK